MLKKKLLLLSIFIFLITFTFISSSSVSAAEKKGDTFTYNKMTMKITKTASNKIVGKVSIKSYTDKKSTKKLIIPSEVKYKNKKYNITCIESAAFKNSKFKELYIPNAIIKIKWHAFNSCTNLTSITIPKSVILSEGHNFSNCTNLRTVFIEKGVTQIPISTFYNCTNLTKVSIPSTVKKIDSYAFHNCSILEEIKLPEGIKEISQDMFSGCKNLSTVNIPNSVTKIDFNSFKNCSSLKTITLSTNVEEIMDNAFAGCDKIIIKIPKNSFLESYAIENNINYTYSNDQLFTIEPISAYDSANDFYSYYKIINKTNKTFYEVNIKYLLLDNVEDQIGGGSADNFEIFKPGESRIISINTNKKSFSDINFIFTKIPLKYKDLSEYINVSIEEQSNLFNETKYNLYNLKLICNSSIGIDNVKVQIVFYKNNRILKVYSNTFGKIYKGTHENSVELPASSQYDDYDINISAYNLT